MVTPAARKEGAHFLMRHFSISERRACRLTGSVRSTQRYPSRRQEPEGLRQAIREVAYTHPRYGYRRVHWVVVRRGHRTGMSRLRRIYREEGLMVRRRRRKRLKVVVRRPMTPPTAPNQRWSMDFVYDQLGDGRRFRVFTVVDDFTRKRTWFASLQEARRRIEAWRNEYNTERPHSSLGDQTPTQFEQTWRAAA